jgi:hypothetical protein
MLAAQPGRKGTAAAGPRPARADLTEIASGLLVEISPDLTISKTLYTVGTPHSDVITHRREHQDFRWLAPGEVSDSLLWESNRQTWERVSQPHQS